MAAIHLIVLNLGSAGPAHPFAPQAAAAIAERIPIALPPAARWNPSWGEAAAAEVYRRLAGEDHDPEAFASGHRYAPGSPLLGADAGESVRGTAAVLGTAPERLSSAVSALREAFTDGEDGRIVQAMADLAVSAADLADPFHVTGFDHEEVPTARARFSDLLAPADFVGLSPASWYPPDQGLEAAVALAVQSAAERRAIEDAVRYGNDDALRVLRRRRLEAALALGHALTRAAWQGARSPSIDFREAPPGMLRISPIPATSLATLAFTLPRAGVARLELFDAAGRKVWTRALGPRPAGAQGAIFGSGVFEALPPGLYLVAVTTSDFRATGRLVHIR